MIYRIAVIEMHQLLYELSVHQTINVTIARKLMFPIFC
jgi:hypothetical protein